MLIPTPMPLPISELSGFKIRWLLYITKQGYNHLKEKQMEMAVSLISGNATSILSPKDTGSRSSCLVLLIIS